MREALLSTKNISKAYSGVPVLNNISIELFSNSVLGIIGENGAGKSTLMKIISGLVAPTSGKIFLQGKEASIPNPEAACNLGISIIPQEFNLIDTLKVYENIFLGKELYNRYGFLKKETMINRSKSILGELEVDIDPEADIGTLSAAEKQMVEISKALSINARLLIMDEPTTVLTEFETDILFNLVLKLKERGFAVVFISHKLDEVKKICDDVLVLRDGNFIIRKPAIDMSKAEMVKSMVGRDIENLISPRKVEAKDYALELKNLSDGDKIDKISFGVRPGEILGLAGLVGAGRTEIAETIIGIRRRAAGEIYINNKAVQIKRTSEAYKLGIGYLSEDRQGKGIITSFPIYQNITLTSIEHYCRSFLKFLVRKKEIANASEYKRKFNIKALQLDARLDSLSGGNQQKVSLAKIVDTRPKVLILDEPTRGVDVSAKQEIYHFIRELAEAGIACILISSEQEEIIKLCHRVIVVRKGSISGEIGREDLTEEKIMFLATGVQENKKEQL